MTPNWPPGAATGIGSLPGEDIDEATRLVLGELPDLPHLPELPARGPAAGMVGRGTAFLADVHVDLQPAGWRLVRHAGLDERRVRGLIARDLDALEQHAADYAGPLKVQAVGPWTLAASLELPRGEKALADPGAVRELAASLAEGLAMHLTQVRRRVPNADLILQLDEPLLPTVLAGAVSTASGLRAIPPVLPAVAEETLRRLFGWVDAMPVVHCCAADPPYELLLRAGARGLSVDATTVGPDTDEQIGTAVDAGVALFFGLVPSTDAELSHPSHSVEPVRRAWRRLGLTDSALASVVVTPTCGLAGASPAYARAALGHCRAAGQLLAEEGIGSE